MSATGRGADRAACDLYETPEWATQRILGALVPLLPRSAGLQRWLEPSAGRGAIPKAVSAWCAEHALHQPTWTLVEARGDSELSALAAASRLAAGTGSLSVDDLVIEDFLELPPPAAPFDVAIGNPPYRLAFDFVRKLVDERWASSVCMLLRMGFLESSARWEWLRERAPDCYVLTSRPSFTGGATDATMYAWMVWRPFDLEPRGRIQLLPPKETKRAVRD